MVENHSLGEASFGRLVWAKRERQPLIAPAIRERLYPFLEMQVKHLGCHVLALGRTTHNPSPAELGARVVEVLEAMYRSAATGAVARISRD